MAARRYRHRSPSTVDSSANAAVTCETFVPDYMGNVYGQTRCWSSINICARYASLTPWTELAALIHHAAEESKAYFAAQH